MAWHEIGAGYVWYGVEWGILPISLSGIGCLGFIHHQSDPIRWPHPVVGGVIGFVGEIYRDLIERGSLYGGVCKSPILYFLTLFIRVPMMFINKIMTLKITEP